MIALLWIHPPLIALIALWTGSPWAFAASAAAGLAAVATGCLALWGERRETHITIAIAMVGTVSLIVAELSGNAWQIDGHMYFFAALAVLTAYCDWVVLLVAAGTIAVHHLVLNFILPAAVFPDGFDLGRVFLHAVIVVLETGALAWLAYQLAGLFTLTQQALAETEAARQAQAQANAREAQRIQEATAERQRVQADLSTRLESEVGAAMGAMTSAARAVHENAESLSQAAVGAASSTAQIVDASEETKVSVQTVASATEQLAASVAEISSQLGRAAGIAHRAVEGTGQATEKMQALAAKTTQIENIVQLITGIASQTNLLALNATIEAARASEAGKGFAVVAGEVKGLASQTAKATDEIKGQVEAIQAEAGLVVSAIAGIARVITELEEITAAVSAAVEEQGAATAEIARAAQLAARGTGSIMASLSGLSEATGTTKAAAEAGYGASGSLKENCEGMAASVHRFVQTMRQA